MKSALPPVAPDQEYSPEDAQPHPERDRPRLGNRGSPLDGVEQQLLTARANMVVGVCRAIEEKRARAGQRARPFPDVKDPFVPLSECEKGVIRDGLPGGLIPRSARRLALDRADDEAGRQILIILRLPTNGRTISDGIIDPDQSFVDRNPVEDRVSEIRWRSMGQEMRSVIHPGIGAGCGVEHAEVGTLEWAVQQDAGSYIIPTAVNGHSKPGNDDEIVSAQLPDLLRSQLQPIGPVGPLYGPP